MYLNYRKHVKHIVAGLGDIWLQKLTPQQVQSFLSKKLNEGLSPKYVREMLGVFVPGLVASGRTTAPTGSLHVHLTDQPGEWSLRVADGAVVVERDHAKADIAIRGGAHDVFLFVWGRRAGDVEVVGDDALLSTWQLGF